MREEFDIGDEDAGARLAEELRSLELRRERLGEDRQKLALGRGELAVVEAYAAARHVEHDGLERDYDAEEKDIARTGKQLRLAVAATRKAAERLHKERLKELAGEHKGTLGELDALADHVTDFEKGDAEEA